MARMRAIEAAVEILKKEGISVAFGVPGAAINPLYTAGNDSNLLIVFYVQIMPDDFVMQLHRF